MSNSLMQKLLSVTLALLLALSACSNSSSQAEPIDLSEEDEYTYEEPAEEEEEPAEPVVQTVEETYEAQWIGHFNNGQATVIYKDIDGAYKYGVIDEDGVLLFEAPSELQDLDGEHYAYKHNNTVTVINDKGEEQFTLDDGEVIVGYGDGLFLIEYTVSSYDSIGTYLYTRDLDGNITEAVQVDDDSAIREPFYYIGEGMFQYDVWHSAEIYNSNSNELISTHYPLNCQFVEGISVGYDGDSYCYCYITPKDLENQSSYDSWQDNKDKTKCVNYDAFISEDGIGITSYSDNPNLYSVRYADVYGNEVMSIDLPEGTKVTQDAIFTDGYGAARFIGVDDQTYIVLFDRNGKLQYEPIPVSRYIDGLDDKLITKNGVLLFFDSWFNTVMIVKNDGSYDEYDGVSRIDWIDDWVYCGRNAGLGDPIQYVMKIDENGNYIKTIDTVTVYREL